MWSLKDNWQKVGHANTTFFWSPKDAMGKDKRKDKDRGKTQDGFKDHPKSLSLASSTKLIPAPKATATANNPNPKPKSAHIGGLHTDPKVAPQAPLGPVPQPFVGTDTKQSTSNDSFIIPKKD